MTPITDSFLNGRVLRPACKALSIAKGKRRPCWHYARYLSNFAAIKESHLQSGDRQTAHPRAVASDFLRYSASQASRSAGLCAISAGVNLFGIGAGPRT